jgi:hypothetical protein
MLDFDKFGNAPLELTCKRPIVEVVRSKDSEKALSLNWPVEFRSKPVN